MKSENLCRKDGTVIGGFVCHVGLGSGSHGFITNLLVLRRIVLVCFRKKGDLYVNYQ